MKGNSGLGSPGDGIHDDIVPQDDKTMLVFWQQTNSGNDRTWPAYKDMSERNFSDDDDFAIQAELRTGFLPVIQQ